MYYQCEPTGARFDPLIDLVIQLTEEQCNSLEPDQVFSIQYYDTVTGNWMETETYVNRNACQVIGEISHFSTYALMVKGSADTTKISTGALSEEMTPETSGTPSAVGGMSVLTWIIVIIAILAVIGASFWYYNKNNY